MRHILDVVKDEPWSTLHLDCGTRWITKTPKKRTLDSSSALARSASTRPSTRTTSQMTIIAPSPGDHFRQRLAERVGSVDRVKL